MLLSDTYSSGGSTSASTTTVLGSAVSAARRLRRPKSIYLQRCEKGSRLVTATHLICRMCNLPLQETLSSRSSGRAVEDYLVHRSLAGMIVQDDTPTSDKHDQDHDKNNGLTARARLTRRFDVDRIVILLHRSPIPLRRLDVYNSHHQ